MIKKALFAVICATTLSFPVQAQDRLSDADLLQTLKTGGNVIVVRHGATNTKQADTDPLHPANIKKQRQLSANGEAAAKSLGQAFKTIGLPVGTVVTSQFNRAYQTAVLAGLPKPQKTNDVTEGGLVVSPDENDRRAAALKKLAATVPTGKTNTVIVTHKPNIVDAFGKDWFNVKEGEATIFKPDGAGYKLIARLQIDEWPKLAGVAAK